MLDETWFKDNNYTLPITVETPTPRVEYRTPTNDVFNLFKHKICTWFGSIILFCFIAALHWS